VSTEISLFVVVAIDTEPVNSEYREQSICCGSNRH